MTADNINDNDWLSNLKYKNSLRLYHIGVAVRFAFLRGIAEVRSEKSRTFLGFGWWILSPLLQFCIYYLIFGRMRGITNPNFVPNLFIGIVSWQLFSSTVLRGSGSIASGAGLGNIIYVHKSLFPLTVMVVNSIKFAFSFLVVFAVLFYAHKYPVLPWISLPVIFAVYAILIIGCCLICASFVPFFPDFQNVLNSMMYGLMFLSGVIFEIKADYNSLLGRLYAYNPIADSLTQIRRVLVHSQWPNWSELISVLVFGLVTLTIGMALICKWDRQYPKIS